VFATEMFVGLASGRTYLGGSSLSAPGFAPRVQSPSRRAGYFGSAWHGVVVISLEKVGVILTGQEMSFCRTSLSTPRGLPDSVWIPKAHTAQPWSRIYDSNKIPRSPGLKKLNNFSSNPERLKLFVAKNVSHSIMSPRSLSC
jgi:hypothetical protein